ncbi:MAG: cytochrome ubiquinol oxidase subunit I [Chlamydiota bacterium]|nr:cytochrome ubiquinol oxidase subunit I [Chlamydiota bacterium]
MDVEILARIQFALTIMFHYIYPPFSIGLGLVLVIVEGMYMKTKNPEYLSMAKFWTKVFALTFAVGVATGIVMEFEFGTNWATYSRYVGDVFGSALAAEGVFAFFLESGFLALLLFGWDRIGPKLHYFSTVMVALGAHFSAIWIVVANSWMQTPAGFKIVGEGLSARAEITSFWGMVFNPSSMTRLGHVVVGCWLQGGFLVASIAAYYLLKKRHTTFAKTSLKVSITICTIAVLIQGVLGDRSGKIVAKHQPLKLAAFESLFDTEKGAPLTIFGIVDNENETIKYRIAIPKLLSFLSFSDFDAEVTGLNAFPKKDWPNNRAIFQIYRVMIGMWIVMLILCLVSIFKWWRGTLYDSKLLLRILCFSVVPPLLANQTGWISAEMGRYPWIVHGLLRISEGLSKSVVANQVFWSIIMFCTIYTFLLIMFLYLLTKKIHHGPVNDDKDTPYHHLQEYVKEIGNE